MKTSSYTRRRFLKTSAVGGAAVVSDQFGHFASQGLETTEASASWSGSTPSWVDKPMRWAQLTLVEDDPGRFDLAFWLDYFKLIHSDGVCLSGGGCVAYYPTKVPFHHRSAWLGDRDVLGDLIIGCRKLGMVILVRTDPHATYDDVAAAHPDWVAVDAEGKPRRHWSSPELWVTCALGPYNFEFMTEVHKEIMARYLVDGIFINRWDGSGQCYCEHCRANFKNASGFDLPRTDDPHDSARRAYMEWREQRLFNLWQLWDSAVRKINRDACVVPNTGGGALSSLDMRQIGELAPLLAADRQARRGLAAPWLNGKNGKEYRATMRRKPVAGLFSIGLEEPYRWKDSVQSAAEIRIWVLDGIANGMRPWFSKFSGVLYDPRWLKVVEEIYHWCYTWERYLRHQSPIARVALVYSQQTAHYYGGSGAATKVEDPTLGWYQALVEARIQFEMVHDRLLDPIHLRPFKTLILPNIAALSDRQCDQLRAFVRTGGSLIATYETSRYDEWGTVRKDFGLGDLFGVTCRDRIEGPIKNSYLRLVHEAVPNHPLLRGLEDAPRIINGVFQVEVEPRERFLEVPLTLIPSYPDLPMEKVFPRQARTDIAEVYLRDLSPAGRVVYFPWDIDRTFWEVLNVDHFKLLRNSVEWATNEKPEIEVTGPGFIEVTAWRNTDAVVVHFINLTNPMTMKGPYREFIPVGEHQVIIRLPKGTSAKTAHLLVANKDPQLARDGDELRITLPSILDHEVLAIDVSG